MKTIGEILKLSSEFLAKKGVKAPRRSAEELLSHLLRCKRVDLYMRYDLPLSEEEVNAMRESVKRRSIGEPVEYITKEAEFFGAVLGISKEVLIPRPETEILLDTVLKEDEALKEKEFTVLDLCTGSGCIAIGLKKRFASLHLYASDLSDAALKVASSNAKKNGCEVTFIHADLFQGFPQIKFDRLFSNPPYIALKELEGLDPEVRDFEPKEALLGGEDGLDFYRRIEKEAPAYLKSGARLYFEMGYTQGEALNKIFASEHWVNKKIVKDWSGKERFFFLEFE